MKKASDPNLASPLTPAPLLSDDTPSGLGQESVIEEFSTPKSNTPMGLNIPLKDPVAEDNTDTLLQLTSDLNKAVQQRDISAFQYVIPIL